MFWFFALNIFMVYLKKSRKAKIKENLFHMPIHVTFLVLFLFSFIFRISASYSHLSVWICCYIYCLSPPPWYQFCFISLIIISDCHVWSLGTFVYSSTRKYNYVITMGVLSYFWPKMPQETNAPMASENFCKNAVFQMWNN